MCGHALASSSFPSVVPSSMSPPVAGNVAALSVDGLVDTIGILDRSGHTTRSPPLDRPVELSLPFLSGFLSIPKAGLSFVKYWEKKKENQDLSPVFSVVVPLAAVFFPTREKGYRDSLEEEEEGQRRGRD